MKKRIMLLLIISLIFISSCEEVKLSKETDFETCGDPPEFLFNDLSMKISARAIKEDISLVNMKNYEELNNILKRKGRLWKAGKQDPDLDRGLGIIITDEDLEDIQARQEAAQRSRLLRQP